MPRRFWSRIKYMARERNLDLTITAKHAYDLFVKQGGLCALTKWPLKFPDPVKNKKGSSTPNCTASLDRIDSAKGYTPGNIQWVHKDVNRMKNVYSQEYFISMCAAVSQNLRA